MKLWIVRNMDGKLVLLYMYGVTSKLTYLGTVTFRPLPITSTTVLSSVTSSNQNGFSIKIII
jgi:hypothetical protein